MSFVELGNQTPPYSLEAETAVLGALVISPDAIMAVLPVVRESDFYREANRRIYRAAVALYEAGTRVDVVTLAERLKSGGELEAAGGYDYLSALIDAVPTAANVTYHARIVREKARLRSIIEGSLQIIRDAYDGGDMGSISVRIDKLNQTLGSAGASDFRQIKDSLWPAFEKIEKMQEGGGQTGIPSGFYKVDQMLGGFQRGDLIIVAARPSMGKTAWVLNALTNAALAGYKAAVVSLEMSSEALTIRQISSMSRVDMQKLKRGELTTEEHQRMAAAAGHINTLPLWIDDHPVSRVAELRAKVTRLVRREGVQIVAVDYLQLMEGGGEENRRLEVGAMTRTLKLMAHELDIPVIALSQLSRAPDARTNHRPILSDLRESGDIEQDADVVMFLYRPEMYIQDGDTKKAREEAQAAREQLEGKAELNIAKQRNGPTGMVPLYFFKAYTRFDDITNDQRFLLTGGPDES